MRNTPASCDFSSPAEISKGSVRLRRSKPQQSIPSKYTASIANTNTDTDTCNQKFMRRIVTYFSTETKYRSHLTSIISIPIPSLVSILECRPTSTVFACLCLSFAQPLTHFSPPGVLVISVIFLKSLSFFTPSLSSWSSIHEWCWLDLTFMTHFHSHPLKQKLKFSLNCVVWIPCTKFYSSPFNSWNIFLISFLCGTMRVFSKVTLKCLSWWWPSQYSRATLMVLGIPSRSPTLKSWKAFFQNMFPEWLFFCRGGGHSKPAVSNSRPQWPVTCRF